MFVNNNGQLKAGDYCYIYVDGDKTITGRTLPAGTPVEGKDIHDDIHDLAYWGKPVMRAEVKHVHMSIEGTSCTFPKRLLNLDDFRYFVDLLNSEPRFSQGHYSIAAKHLVSEYYKAGINLYSVYDDLVAERSNRSGRCAKCQQYGKLYNGICRTCTPSPFMVQ